MYSMWLFIELGYYFQSKKLAKRRKFYYGKKYRFEPELDLNWTWTEVWFKVQPDAWTRPLVKFSVQQKGQRTRLNWTLATLEVAGSCHVNICIIMVHGYYKVHFRFIWICMVWLYIYCESSQSGWCDLSVWGCRQLCQLRSSILFDFLWH